MRSTSARILVYDNSNLQCELLAKGLESLELGLEIVSASDSGSLHTLLAEDANCVVIVSDASMNGSAISFAKQLRSAISRTADHIPAAGRTSRSRHRGVQDRRTRHRLQHRKPVPAGQSASNAFSRGKCGYDGRTWQ